jgi:hypothetical protein
VFSGKSLFCMRSTQPSVIVGKIKQFLNFSSLTSASSFRTCHVAIGLVWYFPTNRGSTSGNLCYHVKIKNTTVKETDLNLYTRYSVKECKLFRLKEIDGFIPDNLT